VADVKLAENVRVLYPTAAAVGRRSACLRGGGCNSYRERRQGRARSAVACADQNICISPRVGIRGSAGQQAGRESKAAQDGRFSMLKTTLPSPPPEVPG